MAGFDKDDRPESLTAHLAAPMGVAMVIVSVVLLSLPVLRSAPPHPPTQVAAGVLGIVGGFLLWQFLRLDWRRVLREPPPGPHRPHAARFEFGPVPFPVPVTRVGTVHLEDGSLVLRYRTSHTWLIATSYVLLQVLPHLDGENPLWNAAAAVGVFTSMGLYAFVHRRTVPLSGVRLAVADGSKILLYHGMVGDSSETTVTMEKPELRGFQEALTPLVPVEVVPPPGRTPARPASSASPRAPRVPPVPPPPRTTIDGRKVKELDRAMRSLDRMNPPADVSNLPPS